MPAAKEIERDVTDDQLSSQVSPVIGLRLHKRPRNEKDIDVSTLQRAVSKLLKFDTSELPTPLLPGEKRYFHEIGDHVNLQEDEARTAKRNCKMKVGLSQFIIEQ